jgi:16S rRNA (adenine1518-N6/adenine1519-N6)-dimethyltransferase
VTVQLEYGQRLTAKPDAKNYGAFSCFVQYYADTKMLFKIKNSSFYPAPKVQSCFCHLKLLKKPKYQVKSEDFLFKIIHACFEQRRKTVQNSLAGVIDKKNIPKLFETLRINPRLRAENLSLDDYARISNAAIEINTKEGKDKKSGLIES